MIFCDVISAARRLGLAAFLSLGLSAMAQQTIQFTKPVDSDPSRKANSFMPDSHAGPSAFNAPASKPAANFDILPGSSQPIISMPNLEQWQKSMDDKKNWTLLTPEEILGIPTPEKILGIKDPNDDPKLSAEDRFLRRQAQQADIGQSNTLRRVEAMMWRSEQSPFMPENPLKSMDPASRYRANVANVAGSSPGGAGDLKTLFRLNTDVPGNQRPPSAWTSPFNSPEPLPKPTPDQLAGQERFRALMVPPSWERTPQSIGFAVQPVPTKSAPDPFLQAAPIFNPAGQSFTPMANSSSKPIGIAPLAGISPPPAPSKKISPLVQQAPWMQSSLQTGYLPQRQF